MFLGDSLTEGVPHYNGETDTVAFQVSQRYPGSTYTKQGYRSQTSEYLLGRLGFLLDLHKPDSDYRNIVILWAGTNDCALTRDCVSGTYNNLSAIGRVAEAIGWKVVVVTIIARNNYFAPGIDAVQFGVSASALNDRLRQLQDFDAVADPARVLTNGCRIVDVLGQVPFDATRLCCGGRYGIGCDCINQSIRAALGSDVPWHQRRHTPRVPNQNASSGAKAREWPHRNQVRSFSIAGGVRRAHRRLAGVLDWW